MYTFPAHHQATIIAVGNNSPAAFLEFHKIIHNLTAKECTAIFKRWLINNDRCPFCFNALHDSLNRGLPEVVRVRLHRQAENANYNIVFPARIVILVSLVCASNFKDTVCYIILARSVTFNNSLNQILGHIGIVSQQLLGVLGQAVAP